MSKVLLIAITLLLFSEMAAEVKEDKEIRPKRSWQRFSKKCEGQGTARICEWYYCFDKYLKCYELEKIATSELDERTKAKYDHVLHVVGQALSTYARSVKVSYTLEMPVLAPALAAAFRLKRPEKIMEVLKMWANNRQKPFSVPVDKLPKTKELYVVKFYTIDGSLYRGIFGETDEGRGWTAGAFSDLHKKRSESRCVGANEKTLCLEMVSLPELMGYTPILKEALKSLESGLEPIHILKLERLRNPGKAISEIIHQQGKVGKRPALKKLYFVVFLTKDGVYQGSFAGTNGKTAYLGEPVTKVKMDDAVLEQTRELLLKKDYLDVFWLWRKSIVESRFLPKSCHVKSNSEQEDAKKNDTWKKKDTQGEEPKIIIRL